MKRIVENFQFQTADELRDWLNQFNKTDLSGVYLNDGEYINVGWQEETLSDGSIANNMVITNL